MNSYFWRGGKDGHLVIRRCGDCGTYHHPYQGACHVCLSRNVGPQPVSGRGTVVAVTVNYQPWFPNIPVPYALALVELEEQAGLRLFTNVVGIDAEEVKAGLRVEVCFEQHGEIFIPLFKPA